MVLHKRKAFGSNHIAQENHRGISGSSSTLRRQNKWHGAQAPTRKVRVRAMMECVEDEVDDDADYDDVVDDG